MTSEEIEDASWQCNGSDIFKDGCYSGQKSFDLHLGTRAWRCVEQQEGEQDDCDFDLCEMCVRWALHCKKTGNIMGVVPEFSTMN